MLTDSVQLPLQGKLFNHLTQWLTVHLMAVLGLCLCGMQLKHERMCSFTAHICHSVLAMCSLAEPGLAFVPCFISILGFRHSNSGSTHKCQIAKPLVLQNMITLVSDSNDCIPVQFSKNLHVRKHIFLLQVSRNGILLMKNMSAVSVTHFCAFNSFLGSKTQFFMTGTGLILTWDSMDQT